MDDQRDSCVGRLGGAAQDGDPRCLASLLRTGGVVANNKGRSGVGWFFLAFLISPLIAGIIVLVIGPGDAKAPAQAGWVAASTGGQSVAARLRGIDERGVRKAKGGTSGTAPTVRGRTPRGVGARATGRHTRTNDLGADAPRVGRTTGALIAAFDPVSPGSGQPVRICASALETCPTAPHANRLGPHPAQTVFRRPSPAGIPVPRTRL
jgi:hypothetical protein